MEFGEVLHLGVLFLPTDEVMHKVSARSGVQRKRRFQEVQDVVQAAQLVGPFDPVGARAPNEMGVLGCRSSTGQAPGCFVVICFFIY